MSPLIRFATGYAFTCRIITKRINCFWEKKNSNYNLLLLLIKKNTLFIELSLCEWGRFEIQLNAFTSLSRRIIFIRNKISRILLKQRYIVCCLRVWVWKVLSAPNKKVPGSNPRSDWGPFYPQSKTYMFRSTGDSKSPQGVNCGCVQFVFPAFAQCVQETLILGTKLRCFFRCLTLLLFRL